MPTIIDCVQRTRVPLAGMLIALAVWFAGMAVLALAIDPPAVVVFGPERNLESAIAATDTPLLSVGPGFVAIRAGQPGLVRRLYGAGAWFVWPVMKAGCLPENGRSRMAGLASRRG
jgi:hypothetical protein